MHLDRECGQARCRKWYLALKVLRYAQTTVCKECPVQGCPKTREVGTGHGYLMQSDNLTFRKKVTLAVAGPLTLKQA